MRFAEHSALPGQHAWGLATTDQLRRRAAGRQDRHGCQVGNALFTPSPPTSVWACVCP